MQVIFLTQLLNDGSGRWSTSSAIQHLGGVRRKWPVVSIAGSSKVPKCVQRPSRSFSVLVSWHYAHYGCQFVLHDANHGSTCRQTSQDVDNAAGSHSIAQQHGTDEDLASINRLKQQVPGCLCRQEQPAAQQDLRLANYQQIMLVCMRASEYRSASNSQPLHAEWRPVWPDESTPSHQLTQPVWPAGSTSSQQMQRLGTSHD